MQIIPPGYVGTIKALMRIAKAAYPARWTREAVTEAEANIWSALGKTLSGDLWRAHLEAQVYPAPPLMIERICDYHEAIAFLRQAMAAGDVVATVIDPLGKPQKIPADIWAISGDDELDNEFLNGAVWLPEQDVQALCERVAREGLVDDDDIFGVDTVANPAPAPPDLSLPKMSHQQLVDFLTAERAAGRRRPAQKDNNKFCAIRGFQPVNNGEWRIELVNIFGPRPRGRPKTEETGGK